MGKDFFEDLGETITQTAKDLKEGAKKLYEVQRIKTKISQEERMILKLKADIGNIIYEKHENENYCVDEKIEKLCAMIKEHEDNKISLEEMIDDNNGTVKCPNCHTSVAKESAFCNICGCDLKKHNKNNREEKETDDINCQVVDESSFENKEN